LKVRGSRRSNFHGGVLLQATSERQTEAIGYYRAALALRPGAAVVHNNLGYALQQNGQLDQACVECRKAIEIDPDWVYPHCNLGNALLLQGQVDEAVKEYRKAVDLDPGLAIAHSNLGYGLREK